MLLRRSNHHCLIHLIQIANHAAGRHDARDASRFLRYHFTPDCCDYVSGVHLDVDMLVGILLPRDTRKTC